MSQKKETSWSEKIANARQLRSRGAALNFERIKMLVEVYKDKQFYIDNNFDEPKGLEYLDDEVGDLCASFKTLMAVIDHFPKKSYWGNNRLHRMVAEVMEEQREQSKGSNAGGRTRKSVTVKEHEQTEKDLSREKSRNKSLSKELTEAKEEIRRLERELAKAEGRIAELERLVEREFSSV